MVLACLAQAMLQPQNSTSARTNAHTHPQNLRAPRNFSSPCPPTTYAPQSAPTVTFVRTTVTQRPWVRRHPHGTFDRSERHPRRTPTHPLHGRDHRARRAGEDHRQRPHQTPRPHRSRAPLQSGGSNSSPARPCERERRGEGYWLRSFSYFFYAFFFRFLFCFSPARNPERQRRPPSFNIFSRRRTTPRSRARRSRSGLSRITRVHLFESFAFFVFNSEPEPPATPLPRAPGSQRTQASIPVRRLILTCSRRCTRPA